MTEAGQTRSSRTTSQSFDVPIGGLLKTAPYAHHSGKCCLGGNRGTVPQWFSSTGCPSGAPVPLFNPYRLCTRPCARRCKRRMNLIQTGYMSLNTARAANALEIKIEPFWSRCMGDTSVFLLRFFPCSPRWIGFNEA